MLDYCNHAGSATIAHRDGRILLLRTPSGSLTGPGGHADELGKPHPEGAPSEVVAFRAAALRHLNEQAGLDLPPAALHLAAVLRTAAPCDLPAPPGGNNAIHQHHVFAAQVPGDVEPAGPVEWLPLHDVLLHPDLPADWQLFVHSAAHLLEAAR